MCSLGRAGSGPGAAGEPPGSIPQRGCCRGIRFHGLNAAAAIK
ncbi:hypothetical protein BAE44_0011696 [Dichanthelium oligosanthes]|uniref:Uncharacterized protein n=1 Tax=Dichanthelium oligosanthes TaxID=888268 RepID=A0A1E5VQ77_9POAL|nr:hypothetical protein BAE44_0011696 [Dichanthelium oligosanthes]